MNITNILQSISLILLAAAVLVQQRRIRELEEKACEMTKAIIKTRMELELPLFPPEPEEEEEK